MWSSSPVHHLLKQSAPDETSPVDDLERDELELETDTTLAGG